MRLTRLLVVAVVALVVVVARVPAPPSARATEAKPDWSAAEVLRIRAHFDSVLTELATRDLSTLGETQRGQRAVLLQTLRAYRDRGVFPHNYDFPGQAVPYFVDRKTGTLCAVAHLVESTGRRDIVDRVARLDNNVLVPRLAGDSAFTSWLDAHGITLAEAARIQVPYNAQPMPLEDKRFVAGLVLAPLAITATAVTSVWNAWGNSDGHRRGVSVVGVTSGVLAVGAGAMLASNTNLPKEVYGVAAITAVTGGIGIALSSRSISRRRAIVAAEREATEKRSIAQATLIPILPSRDSGAGVGVSLKF
jgi:hypothetical protein